jgi:hypothetical protein
MIGWFLGELAVRIVGGLVRPSRRTASATPSGRAPSREVTVSEEEMSARVRDYEAWAASRGLGLVRETRSGPHGARFRGTRSGRAIELTTGLGEYGPPRSPELLVWTDAVAPEEPVMLSRDAARPATPWARELDLVLDADGVRDIGVTTRFVRVRFHAFVAPKALGRGWDALEGALATLSNAAKPDSPYR